MNKLITTFVLFLISIRPMIANGADGTVASPDRLVDPLDGQSFEDLIGTIIDWMIRISAPILVIFIIYGGFQILTAGDDEAKYQKGKKTITYAVIGFAIILLAKGLILVIKEFLGVTSSSPMSGGGDGTI